MGTPSGRYLVISNSEGAVGGGNTYEHLGRWEYYTLSGSIAFRAAATTLENYTSVPLAFHLTNLADPETGNFVRNIILPPNASRTYTLSPMDTFLYHISVSWSEAPV